MFEHAKAAKLVCRPSLSSSFVPCRTACLQGRLRRSPASQPIFWLVFSGGKGETLASRPWRNGCHCQ
jgi:hypothetical protein